MKLCLICGASVADNAPSCPKCGEASWRYGIKLNGIEYPAAVRPEAAPGPEFSAKVPMTSGPQSWQQAKHNKGRR